MTTTMRFTDEELRVLRRALDLYNKDLWERPEVIAAAEEEVVIGLGKRVENAIRDSPIPFVLADPETKP